MPVLHREHLIVPMAKCLDRAFGLLTALIPGAHIILDPLD